MFTWSHILWRLFLVLAMLAWQAMSHITRVTSVSFGITDFVTMWQEHSCVRTKSFSSRTVHKNCKALVWTIIDYATNIFRPLYLVNVTKRRDVVKLILLLSFITLWCLFDDITDISQAKDQCLYILRFCSLDFHKTWQNARSFVSVSVSCLCEINFQCQSPSLGRVTRVRYDSSSRLTTYWYWSLYHKFDLRSIFRCQSAIIAA